MFVLIYARLMKSAKNMQVKFEKSAPERIRLFLISSKFFLLFSCNQNTCGCFVTVGTNKYIYFHMCVWMYIISESKFEDIQACKSDNIWEPVTMLWMIYKYMYCIMTCGDSHIIIIFKPCKPCKPHTHTHICSRNKCAHTISYIRSAEDIWFYYGRDNFDVDILEHFVMIIKCISVRIIETKWGMRWEQCHEIRSKIFIINFKCEFCITCGGLFYFGCIVYKVLQGLQGFYKIYKVL